MTVRSMMEYMLKKCLIFFSAVQNLNKYSRLKSKIIMASTISRVDITESERGYVIATYIALEINIKITIIESIIVPGRVSTFSK